MSENEYLHYIYGEPYVRSLQERYPDGYRALVEHYRYDVKWLHYLCGESYVNSLQERDLDGYKSLVEHYQYDLKWLRYLYGESCVSNLQENDADKFKKLYENYRVRLDSLFSHNDENAVMHLKYMQEHQPEKLRSLIRDDDRILQCLRSLYRRNYLSTLTESGKEDLIRFYCSVEDPLIQKLRDDYHFDEEKVNAFKNELSVELSILKESVGRFDFDYNNEALEIRKIESYFNKIINSFSQKEDVKESSSGQHDRSVHFPPKTWLDYLLGREGNPTTEAVPKSDLTAPPSILKKGMPSRRLSSQCKKLGLNNGG